MRIVMVCPESPLPGGLLFDRRIIQQGKTLNQADHDVYLIARPGADLPSKFETEGIHVILHDNSGGEGHKCTSRPHGVRIILDKLKHAASSSIIGPWLKQLYWTIRSVPGQAQTRNVPSIPPDVADLTCDDKNLVEQIVRLKPDCVVAHDLPVLRPVVAAGKACKAKIVYDSHEYYPEQSSLSSMEKDYFRSLESYWIGKVDLAYTVNPLLSDLMSKTYGRPIESILNAIDAPTGVDLTQRRDHLHQYLKLSKDHKILLYQGGIAPQRGLENLIAAMNHVKPSVHLAFLGYGNHISALSELSRDYGLQHRVHFVPPRAQADLLEWTASADAGIIPYHNVDKNSWYVSPNKMFEYITAQLPFLSNELSFVRMVVNDVQGGIVADLTTPTACAEAINRMFARPEQLQRMRRNLGARRDEYSWRKQGLKLLGLYESIGIQHGLVHLAA